VVPSADLPGPACTITSLSVLVTSACLAGAWTWGQPGVVAMAGTARSVLWPGVRPLTPRETDDTPASA
jgi:hypothetical protein